MVGVTETPTSCQCRANFDKTLSLPVSQPIICHYHFEVRRHCTTAITLTHTGSVLPVMGTKCLSKKIIDNWRTTFGAYLCPVNGILPLQITGPGPDTQGSKHRHCHQGKELHHRSHSTQCHCSLRAGDSLIFNIFHEHNIAKIQRAVPGYKSILTF